MSNVRRHTVAANWEAESFIGFHPCNCSNDCMCKAELAAVHYICTHRHTHTHARLGAAFTSKGQRVSSCHVASHWSLAMSAFLHWQSDWMHREAPDDSLKCLQSCNRKEHSMTCRTHQRTLSSSLDALVSLVTVCLTSVFPNLSNQSQCESFPSSVSCCISTLALPAFVLQLIHDATFRAKGWQDKKN